MGNRYALIIANFEYDNIPKLKAPKYDAEKLKEVLENPELGGFECKLLLDRYSSDVMDEIEEFYDRKKIDDTLLLYYSGHGMRDKKRNLHLTFKKTIEGDLIKKAIEISEINKKISGRNRRRDGRGRSICCSRPRECRMDFGKSDL